MKILIFATAYNGLCQRIHKELLNASHRVCFELSPDSNTMLQAFKNFQPELIICPFLKHRIPDSIWSKIPCLVLHPGIVGDRGPSSLDWAITNKSNTWGVTLLQANAVYDAGEIWGSRYFSVNSKLSKASIYRHSVTNNASKLILDAAGNFETVRKTQVDLSAFPIVGKEQPLMKQADRQINWRNDSSEDIVRKINAADSFPGVLDKIENQEYFLYGAIAENLQHNVTPGEIIGMRDEAICRATIDGAVWIRQLRERSQKGNSFKLPALRKLDISVPEIFSDVQNDVRIEVRSRVAYLHFNFYNGAFSTENCLQLLSAFNQLKNAPEIKVIVLMGGDDFFSNGINLNCIQSASDPTAESWRNINAINDLVKSIIECESKLTVAALKCNAGAGGAILPLACDYVIARDGIVFNPHYKTMGLSGSEYWTYLLPKRVGQNMAQKLTTECLPILASEAEKINYVDTVFAENMEDYLIELKEYCKTLANSDDYDSLITSKRELRAQEEAQKSLQSYRDEELKLMRQTFDDPQSSYHTLRRNFVYKINCGKTPERLKTAIEEPMGFLDC
ncbi:MAG: enoyl-CoA hydratase-related protein [Kangiellaceae bacterium]|nr:enoyl-CoA hydratase-related protein [Kangiellaceae bacterium]MCW8997404.1 enoyl-CoA hydratase-related protein [Kangiellaceae bacterium]MCW9017499.1 enoyl-CoA hydratase-related protein [Kangiellaceae bacterium]